MFEDRQWMIPSSPPIDIWVGLTSFPIPWAQLQGDENATGNNKNNNNNNKENVVRLTKTVTVVVIDQHHNVTIVHH